MDKLLLTLTTLAVLGPGSPVRAQAPKGGPATCPAGLVADTAGLASRTAKVADLRGFRGVDRCVVRADFDGDGLPDRIDELRRSSDGFTEWRLVAYSGKGEVVDLGTSASGTRFLPQPAGSLQYSDLDPETGAVYTRPAPRPFLIVEIKEDESSRCIVVGHGMRPVELNPELTAPSAGWGQIGRSGAPGECRVTRPEPRPAPVEVAKLLHSAQSAAVWRDPALEKRLACVAPEAGLRFAGMFRAIFPEKRVTENCVWMADLNGDWKPDYIALLQDKPQGEFDLPISSFAVITSNGHVAAEYGGIGDEIEVVRVIPKGTRVSSCGGQTFDRDVFTIKTGDEIIPFMWVKGSGLYRQRYCP